MWFQGNIYNTFFSIVNDVLSRKHLYPSLDALKLFQRLVSSKLWQNHCKKRPRTYVSLQFPAYFCKNHLEILRSLQKSSLDRPEIPIIDSRFRSNQPAFFSASRQPPHKRRGCCTKCELINTALSGAPFPSSVSAQAACANNMTNRSEKRATTVILLFFSFYSPLAQDAYFIRFL